MRTTSIGLLLLLLSAGCQKYAAAGDVPDGHRAATPPRQHLPQQQIESEPYREECKWNRQLFC